MARNSRADDAEKPATEQKDSAAVTPVFAIHSITYGKGQHAPAGSMFVPVSQEERDDLMSLEAVRELDETEAKVFAVNATTASAGDVKNEGSDEIA